MSDDAGMAPGRLRVVAAALAFALSLGSSSCGPDVGPDELAERLGESIYSMVLCGAQVGIENRVEVTSFRYDAELGRGRATVRVFASKAAGSPPVRGPCTGEVEFTTSQIAIQSSRRGSAGGVIGHSTRLATIRVLSRAGQRRVEPRVPLARAADGSSYEGFPGTLSAERDRPVERVNALLWGDVERPDGRREDDYLDIRADARPVRIDVWGEASGDAPGETTPVLVEVLQHDRRQFEVLRPLAQAVRTGHHAIVTYVGPGSFRIRVTTEGPGLRQGLYRIRRTVL